MVDEEHPPPSVQRFELRPVLEQPHLLDRDLAERPVGCKGHEVRMGGEEERIFGPLIGRPFLALRDDREVVRQVLVVQLDLLWLANQRSSKAPCESRLAHALRTRDQDGLRDPFLLDRLYERGDYGFIAEKVREAQLLS